MIPCAIGTPDCTTGSFGYSAGPGYDLATGLGSVDVANLASSWNATASETSVTVNVNKTSMSMSDSVQLAITVAPSSGSAVATGTVYASLSNTTTPETSLPGELPLGSATLKAGSSTLQIYGGQLSAGANTVTVIYDGNAELNGSSATVKLNVSIPTKNSAVVASAYPYYYDLQVPPIGELPNVQGYPWRFVLKLKEVAGVETTLTGLSINGVDQKTGGLVGQILVPHGTLQGVLGVNVPSVPTTIPVLVSGQDPGGFQWTTGLQVELVGPEQFVGISAPVNGASYQYTYAPGMIMSVFGGGLNNPLQSTGQAQSLPLPLTLAGSSATINGVPAPYYYASDGQVNIQIPYETAPGAAVLTITGWIGQSSNYAFLVQPSAPGIFVDAKNNAPVPSETGSPGQEVVLYVTGDGLVKPALATGASPASGTPLDQLPKPVLPVTVMVANTQAKIAFIGIVPGIAGATQINYIIPANTPSGIQPVFVIVGDAISPPAFLTVQ